MINKKSFSQAIAKSSIAPWEAYLLEAVDKRFSSYTHGEIEQWQLMISHLPTIEVSGVDLTNKIKLSTNNPLSGSELNQLIAELKILHPWRKGPFDLFGVNIDTEWRSDWKWERIIKKIAPLKNRTVLDVGCGNGYHCWRMLGENARFVLGIDPSQKYLAQFSVLQNYIRAENCHMLPLALEDMPDAMEKNNFDSIFCMGVLYHQKSPVSLLYRLKNLLNDKGELVLETLIVDGDENTLLVPKSRYAQMRNVWFLPSIKLLEIWLFKVGFSNINIVDINQTSLEEQRTTEWMTFHSLSNFLDQKDINKTIEGYPAPKRVTITANKRL